MYIFVVYVYIKGLKAILAFTTSGSVGYKVSWIFWHLYLTFPLSICMRYDILEMRHGIRNIRSNICRWEEVMHNILVGLTLKAYI